MIDSTDLSRKHQELSLPERVYYGQLTYSLAVLKELVNAHSSLLA